MAKVDITIKKRGSDELYDIDFDSEGDIETTEGLETAVILSLFGEKRASASDVASAESRRGWWGNLLNQVEDYQVGSKLWLLEQARLTQETINSSRTFAQEGFQWFIEDNLLDNVLVKTNFTDSGIKINIDLLRAQNKVFSKSYDLWENTNLYNE